MRWNHNEAGLWPTPDDREVDLNSRAIGWIDTAAAVRDRLLSYEDEIVVAHVDWTPQNVWWRKDGTPLVVHDMDSLAALPEPVVAGAAGAIYVADATVDDTARFLSGMQRRPDSGRQTSSRWHERPDSGCCCSTQRRTLSRVGPPPLRSTNSVGGCRPPACRPACLNSDSHHPPVSSEPSLAALSLLWLEEPEAAALHSGPKRLAYRDPIQPLLRQHPGNAHDLLEELRIQTHLRGCS